MMSEPQPVNIIPTLAQWQTLEAHNLDLRKCTTLEDSPSTLFHWQFNDDDVVCSTIHTTGSIEIESRDFDTSGWTKIKEEEGRCYGCDYLTDDLTDYEHEGETVALCKECLA